MTQKHSILTRVLHWITALLILGLFVSGWYMLKIDYYSPWYQTLPELHVFVGIVLLGFWMWVLFRLYFIKSKQFSQPHNRLERVAARWVKRFIYLLVLLVVCSGYLMATGGGEPVLLFNLIKLPALSHLSSSQIDNMGWIHKNMSYTLMVLVLVHVLGAFKHHFIDQDETLKRML